MTDKKVEFWVHNKGYDGLKYSPHALEMYDRVGGFAMQLIERWGMVAGEPDGEDSAGRSKLKLQSVNSLVARAFDTAELADAVARDRGHIIDVPDREAMIELGREQGDKN